MEKESKVIKYRKIFYRELYYRYYDLNEREFIKNLFYCIYLDDDERILDQLYNHYLLNKINLINPMFTDLRNDLIKN